MEVMARYKKTEVGVIPGDWDAVELRAVCSMKSGETITSARIDQFSQYPCFGGNGLRGFTSRYTHDGCFALIGRQGALCGNVIGADGKFFASEHAIVVTARSGFDIQFITYVLGKMHLNRHSESSAQPGLSVSKIISLPLAIPPTQAEQRAISVALTSVDVLLEGLQQLIAKKCDLKQAAMQQLLSGKRRLPGFSGAWEVKRLGDVGAFFKGKGIKKDETKSEGSPCIRYGEIYTRYNDFTRSLFTFISSEVASQSQKIFMGDLAFAGSGETSEEIGKCVAYMGDEEAYAGGDTVILRPNGQNSMFLGYYLNTPAIATQKARLGQGDAVVHISASHLAQIQVLLPGKNEQAWIREVF